MVTRVKSLSMGEAEAANQPSRFLSRSPQTSILLTDSNGVNAEPTVDKIARLKFIAGLGRGKKINCQDARSWQDFRKITASDA